MNENNKSLLPINASKLLKDLEKSGLKISYLEAKNKDVLNPNKLGIDILPWLAWSLSIDSWDDNWSEEIKREMVKNSISLHRIKGTKKAIKKALDIVGVFGEIVEWWEVSPKMVPHSFNITAYLNDNSDIIDLDTQQKLINLIENVKPARSHFNFKLGARFEYQMSYGAMSRVKQFANFSFIPELPKFENSSLILTKIRTTLYKQVNLYG